MSELLRTLPHDLEAERAVLGAVLIDNATYDRVGELLVADDFFRRAHAAIWSSIVVMLNEKKTAVDLISLRVELERHSEFDEVGGPAYISALTDGIPRSANIEHYARIVREASTRRKLIAAAKKILCDAYETEISAAEVIVQADRAIVDLQRGAEPGRLVDVRTRTGAIMEDLEYRVNHRGVLSGVPTGFASVDELTDGWQRSDMIVLAARPSIGKTAFILNTAVAAASSTGRPVPIFSLEMRAKQLELRMLASLSGVDARQIRRGDLGDFDFEKLAPAMTRLQELPIFIDDRGSQTIWGIRAACRRLRSEHGPLGLIIIDYVQLMHGTLDRRGASRNDELTDISRRTKVLAAEIDAPILLLSQLNRAGDSRQDKRPILSDLRESGAFEQDADVVVFLHRKHHRESGPTAIIFDKQRNGPGGSLILTFDRETQTFTDGGEEPAADPEPARKPKQRSVFTKPGH